MILLIDNYDSFSYNLYQLVGELEPDIQVIRNDAMTVEEIRKLHPDRIILSPGPGRPEDAGVTMEVAQDSGQGHPHFRRLPGTPGHLRGLRRYRHLRKAADAREAVPGAVRCGLPPVSSLSGGGAGGTIPLSGGGQRHHPRLPDRHRPHHRRGSDGGAAQGVPHLWGAVPSGVHPDAGREDHAYETFITGGLNHDSGSHCQRLSTKQDLTYDEAYTVMNEIMSGETTPTQNAAFLAALSTKSARAETTDEIAGCAAAMRDHATPGRDGHGLLRDCRHRRRQRPQLQHLHHLRPGGRCRRHEGGQARQPGGFLPVRHGGLPGGTGGEHRAEPGEVRGAAARRWACASSSPRNTTPP